MRRVLLCTTLCCASINVAAHAAPKLVNIEDMQATPKEADNHTRIVDDFSVTDKTRLFSDDEIREYVKIFFKHCSTLKNWWSHVSEKKITIEDNYAEFTKDLGWRYSFEISARMPSDLPPEMSFSKTNSSVANSVLFYNLGGGNRPGFYATPDRSLFMCGLPESAGEPDKTFVPVSELSIMREK